MIGVLKAIINGLVVVLIFALLALGICTIALQFPSVQTSVVQMVTTSISEKLKYPVSIERVNIKWFDVVSLEGVAVKDTNQKNMIDVGRIDVNLNLNNIIENAAKEIHLDEVNIYQPTVHLVVVPEAGMLNMDGFIERIGELTAPAVPRPPNVPENNTPFTIGRSKVIDGTFTYDDPREGKRTGSRTFDYYHFRLNHIHGDLKDFLVQGDTISFVARNLRTVDHQTGLQMHELSTRFLFSQKKMELKELDAHIGKSHLKDQIVFLYQRSGELGDFNHKVFIKGHLKDSQISSTDLGLFSTYVDALHENWKVSGDFNGKVDDFVLSNTDLHFGKGSRIIGSLGFKGLPKLEGVWMDLQLSLSKIQPEDIVQYYPEWDMHPTLDKFGVTLLDGSFKGTLEDFAVKADVSSALGQLACDLMFHVSGNEFTTYAGKISSADFELGKLLDDEETYQRIDMDGTISGKGLEVKYASTNLDAVVSRIGFKDYNYRNIKLKGNLQNQYFNGEVSARDSNLVLSLDGEFDLSKARNSFDVNGVIQRANLRELGLVKDSITLKTDLDIKLSGNSVDDLTGNAKLLNTFLLHSRKDRNLVVDTLILSSVIREDRRSVLLASEFLTAKLEGDFLPTQAWKDISRVMQEYKLYFFENENSRAAYYAKKPLEQLTSRYQIDYEVEGRNLPRFFAFLSPDLYLSRGARVEGTFKIDNTAFLTLNMTADTARYGKNEFQHSEVDITTSKFVNNAEVLASALVTSEKQQISVLVPTEKLELEGTWDEDHIDFNGGIRQVSSTNKANLKGEIRFQQEGLDISFKDSKLNLLEEEWNVPDNSLISIAGTEVTLRNLGLVSGKQRIALNGLISSDPDKSLNLEIRNFRLNSINPVFNIKLAGIMDGSAKIRDIYKSTGLDVSFNVESLGYDKYEFGNFSGSGDWDQVTGALEVDAHLDKNLSRVFNLTGSYRPTLPTNTLNMKAVFNQIDFKSLEPFTQGLVSDISGRAQGTVTIKGVVNAPVLEGSLMVEKGRMKFDYLQSVFTFSDKINFSESEISVNNILLTDTDGNTATVRGGVFHDGFKLFSLGFNADLRSFKILNTTAQDNDMFYGTAFVTGPVSVYGPIDNLNIEANATSNKGTKIFIPLDGATEVATQDYIQFVSQLPKEDTSKTGEKRRQETLAGGIKMDFNFNLTPDATCEIIFDRQTGDIIRGVGSGRINMNIDTQGDFTMAGTYEIEKGDYNFTLQNVINKKFTIKRGSRIVWSGDPYGAQLDVKAGYTQSVSLLGVLNNQGTGTTTNDVLSRRYPVEVTIGLSDKLMSPQIKYDLKILDNPTLSSNNYQGYLEAFQNKLKTDEQELSRQVTSLLVMNQLLPESSLASQATGQSFLGNSISELVSNQISRWASEINENLEVGVSGLSLDQNALNNLQLRFSYRFLNDRFRVTRDGRISNGTVGGATQYDAASILGEWTLEYWLNRTGSVRVKAYNRNIQNNFLLNGSFTTGGVSMQFTHSFNRFVPMTKPGVRIPFVPVDTTRQDTAAGKLISTKIIPD